MLMERNANIIKDLNGNKIVLISDVIFKGKKSVDWDDVRIYLESYIDEFYEIADTKDIIYIGKDLPDEYTGSKYTYSLKGANAKAKANASQGIPEMLEIATGKHFRENSGKNISEVQQMAGTDTILVLRFQFMRTMARFTDIMCSMHPF